MRTIDDACLSYRHDFGLLSENEQGKIRFQAKEWLRSFGMEEAAALIQQLTAERDAQADANTKLLQALFDATKHTHGLMAIRLLVERAEAAEQRVKELEADVFRINGFAQKYKRHMEAAEQQAATMREALADSEANVEALARSIHETGSDDTVAWQKQSSRYRSQQRRTVRSVLFALRTSLKGSGQ